MFKNPAIIAVCAVVLFAGLGGAAFYAISLISEHQAHKDAPIIAKAVTAGAQATVDAHATVSGAKLAAASSTLQHKALAYEQTILAAPAIDPATNQVQLVSPDVDADWRAAIAGLRQPAPGSPGDERGVPGPAASPAPD